MPGPFDTTTKYLVERYPTDWLAFLGFGSPDAVDVINANLSAVSAEVDKVVRVGGALPWLAHLEFQTSYDPTMGRRMLRYNAMLHLQHELPVASVLVLLRPQADGPAMNRAYEIALPNSEPYLSFRYEVRRVWQEPAATLLQGDLGTLSLAPLGATSIGEVPGLLRSMDQRFEQEAPLAEAGRLRVVTYTLLGLKYPTDVVDGLMPGLERMRDSATYQAILDEGRAVGRAEGERRLLVLYGTPRLGPPDASTRAQLDAITDADVLYRLAEQLFTVSSWAELLSSGE